MPGRRWQATLLLISFIAVLFSARALTGGRTYAAGVTPPSFVDALQAGHQSSQAEPGHQTLDDEPSTADKPGRVQRWRQRIVRLLLPPVIVFLTVLAATRPALYVIPQPTGSTTARPPPARRRPLRPRAP